MAKWEQQSSVKNIQKVVGCIVHYSVISGRPLSSFYHGLKFLARHSSDNPNKRIRLWTSAKEEINKWWEALVDNQWMSKPPEPRLRSFLVTDACGETGGIGGVLVQGTRIFTYYERRSTFHSINDLEAEAVHAAIRIWSKKLVFRVIDLFSDNTAVVATLLSRHSKSYHLNAVIGNISHLLQQLCSVIVPRYVPSKKNPADGISRGKGFSTADRALLRELQHVVSELCAKS